MVLYKACDALWHGRENMIIVHVICVGGGEIMTISGTRWPETHHAHGNGVYNSELLFGNSKHVNVVRYVRRGQQYRNPMSTNAIDGAQSKART